MSLSSRKYVAIRLGLWLIIAGFVSTSVRAQELIKDSTKPASEPTVNERVRLLESELERQNAKLDQLQKTIAEQQQALQTLLEKLSSAEKAQPLQTPSTNAVASIVRRGVAPMSRTARASAGPLPCTTDRCARARVRAV